MYKEVVKNMDVMKLFLGTMSIYLSGFSIP